MTKIYSGSDLLGDMDKLPKKIKGNFGLKQEVFIAEINIDRFMQFVNLEKRFSDIPKYPSVKRDISLIVGKDISFKDICDLIREEGKGLVKEIECIGLYSGEQIPKGHNGLSFRIEYRDRTRTLTSEEVDKIHNAIRDFLVDKLKVTLR